MEMITSNSVLQSFCEAIKNEPYIACDTEFLRETTYYPKLCLIQVASHDRAVIIDPLAEGMDLSPLFALFNDPKIVKVFHAASQDLEIMYQLSQAVPAPIFDTQIAAMVCGFGDSVSYAGLVRSLVQVEIDKRHQFTDWSQRPLSEAQLDYALADVTHLHKIYPILKARLDEQGRHDWVAQEITALEDPKTYEVDIERLWRRIKCRKQTPLHLGIIEALVAWREDKAQSQNKPRGFVMKDTVISDIALLLPQKTSDFKRIRSTRHNHLWSEEEVLTIINEVRQREKSTLPKPVYKPQLNDQEKAIYDLLKLLLKVKAEQHNIADRLIATSSDLTQLVLHERPEIDALKGWRYEVFGADALALKRGEIALQLVNSQVTLIRS